LTGTFWKSPPGRSIFLYVPRACSSKRTLPSDFNNSDSATPPSTTALTPSLTFTVMSFSPLSRFTVAITPDLSEGTERSSKTEGYTCSLDFRMRLRQSHARSSQGEAHTSLRDGVTW